MNQVATGVQLTALDSSPVLAPALTQSETPPPPPPPAPAPPPATSGSPSDVIGSPSRFSAGTSQSDTGETFTCSGEAVALLYPGSIIEPRSWEFYVTGRCASKVPLADAGAEATLFSTTNATPRKSCSNGAQNVNVTGCNGTIDSCANKCIGHWVFK